MDSYGKSKELSQKMQNCLQAYADMLGPQDARLAATYGFTPGLLMTAEQQALEKQLNSLKEGVFQVLFVGGFNAGKSTVLNALMKKDILRTAITAETAVITKIVFGKDEKIIIYEKSADQRSGAKKSREMSVTQFFDEHRVDQKIPDKFDSIDYVVLQQPGDGLAGSLVQLIDSPGTGNSEEDTMAARRFANQANAIVYLLNSTQAFTQEDKDYISSHYANKQMHNVFFVCNQFDRLNKQEQEQLKMRVPENLHEVFVDSHGNFDESLFQHRVFYTNAYGSLLSRLGKPMETPFGTFMIDDETTGVPAFEAALGEYLTAEDRDKEAFRSYMGRLAGWYASAMDRIENILNDYRKGAEELMNEQADFESKKVRLDNIISQIEKSCQVCVSEILLSAKSEYNSCMNSIEAGWDEHFESVKIPFGMTDLIRVVINGKNKAKVRELTKPFADAVQEYVKEEFNSMGTKLARDMNAHLNTLESQLSGLQAQLENLELPISVDDLRQTLLGSTSGRGEITVDGSPAGNSNLFQIVLGIIGMDPDGIAAGMAGNVTNAQAVINFLFKNILEFIALYVVAWPIGIAMIVYRIRQAILGMKNAESSRATDILLEMKKDTVKSLRTEQDKYIMELENQLSTLTRAGKTMADAIRVKADDYGASLNVTIEKLNTQTDTLESETERTGKIKAKLLESISDMNMALNGAPLTDEDVRKLAV